MTLRTALAEGGQSVMGVERAFRAHVGELSEDVRWDPRPSWPRVAPGVHLDPGDPSARRCPWGGVLTLDGLDLETMTPPEPIRLGGVRRLHDGAARGRSDLEELLRVHAPWVRLTGCSTHVGIEVPDERVVAAAHLVVERHAPALMLAFDRSDSPGILVRPRPGRLEIWGEFTAGRQLRTAVALSLGVALLAHRSVRHAWSGRSAPGLLARLECATGRYGWYVDRTAFGPDLHRGGRAARLAGRGVLAPGVRTAQEALEHTWTLARPLVEPVLDDAELTEVDRLVDGTDPLPREAAIDADEPTRASAPDRCYGARDLPDGTHVEIETATRDRAILRVEHSGTTRRLTVPGRALEAFLDALDAPTGPAELAELCRTRARSHAA
jgi:hypothetical protein